TAVCVRCQTCPPVLTATSAIRPSTLVSAATERSVPTFAGTSSCDQLNQLLMPKAASRRHSCPAALTPNTDSAPLLLRATAIVDSCPSSWAHASGAAQLVAVSQQCQMTPLGPSPNSSTRPLPLRSAATDR